MVSLNYPSMLDQFREAFPPQDPFLGSRFSATNWTTPLPHVVPSVSPQSAVVPARFGRPIFGGNQIWTAEIFMDIYPHFHM